MSSNERAKRLKIRVPIQLTGPNGKIYSGISNDLSPSGFSAFLRCREDFVVEELTDNAFVLHGFPRLEQLFVGKSFRTVFNLDMQLPPWTSSINRVENSWLRGFEVFVAARFDELDSDRKSRLESYIDSRLEHLPAESLIDDPERLRDLDAVAGDLIELRFPGRYVYIPIVRDACEQLARQSGFSETDCFKIKVTADEVFSNAFRHGSPEYGENTIEVTIKIDPAGMLVRVRDQGGVPFNFKRFRDAESTNPAADRSGLHLVDRFVDNWVVNIKQGEYTEVTFYKRKEGTR